MCKLVLIAALVGSSLLAACNDSTSSVENPITNDDCTLTQGYWKNHPTEWPVSSLKLGNTTYTKAEALSILGEVVHGNGLVSLAHQLIAAKLNVASGASNTAATAIANGDALLRGNVVPPVGMDYVPALTTQVIAQALDNYNTGKTGPGHCEGVGKAECTCGDGVIHAPEQCDDGNTVDGDGCSSICRIELTPEGGGGGGGSGSGSGSGSDGSLY